ncbi:hypothetical protein F0562_017605 [Nyssa sinensis]|uniref:non-specific serine/threonine protein kinase n=1 Tax=Nyssa sinensis TaxID=561372 RepID=A0A5J4ZII6_9ASTE|nr:hypothetical protein F0562_017605 [Nyssa sinensis]
MGFLSGLCFSLEKRGRSTGGREEEADDGGEPLELFYELRALQEATNFFSESNLLSRGGFSLIYKGLMPNGQEVAVKKFPLISDQGLIEFTNEVKLLLKAQQKNLVALLGCCAEGYEMILVHEYLPNGSLEDILFEKIAHLDWPKRFQIITGVARGLLYLHEEAPQRIIHGDIKARNILLDEQLNPKIANLGMARFLHWTDPYGYMAPKYLMHRNLSVKTDVFNFGVLVLEIISGERIYDWHGRGETDFLSYAWMLFQGGRSLDLVDPSLDEWDFGEVAMCIQLGLLCCQGSAEERPDMSCVHLMLSSDSSTLPIPGKPSGVSGGIVNDNDENSFSFSSIYEGR